MRATARKEVTVTLEMDEAEAEWLRAYTQNQLTEIESPDDRERWRNIWAHAVTISRRVHTKPWTA